jgi:hypothetical protein
MMKSLKYPSLKSQIMLTSYKTTYKWTWLLILKPFDKKHSLVKVPNFQNQIADYQKI